MKRGKSFTVSGIAILVLCVVAWIIWRRDEQKTPLPLPQMIPTVCKGERFTGQVVGVSDGDTVDVMRGGAAARIRLYGVDAPEKAQAYGQRAKEFTSDQAFRKVVTVCVTDRDRYGRLVADVTLPNGHSLNRELVAAGLAWWYRRYSSDRSLGVLEEEARMAHRGLWVDRNPTPPWDWRKEGRSDEGKSRAAEKRASKR
jgi:micrococcal nuclease